MLLLNSITLTRFKNYPLRKFDFTGRIAGICGLNGVGKTNLLDAIYYCCFTRSDSQVAQSGAGGFRIEGHFSLHDQLLKVVCILRETGKKEFLVNDEPYEKFASHIGRLPAVMIAPDDVQIITGGSEERRRLIDALLSQMDADYLKQLMDYNKVLQQRNGFLKAQAGNTTPDIKLLEVYDQQLSGYGRFIYEKRNTFLQQFIPLVNSFYNKVAGKEENIVLQYDSQLHAGTFENLLLRLRDKDVFLQRTNGGIHKDDINFSLNGLPFKSIASQGQRKSLLFALKLAEFETLKQEKGFAPLLLLDDVFEKLDEERMHNLLHFVCVQNEGQIFITDTHEERIRQHFDELDLSCTIFCL